VADPAVGHVVVEITGLMDRYERILSDPEALIAEVRRLGQRPHVMTDPELSLMLGLLVGRVRELQALVDEVFTPRDPRH
jgi:hypothetical protein